MKQENIINEYSYKADNPFVKKINYSYSKYEGKKIIYSWKEYRESFITKKEIKLDLKKYFDNIENKTNSALFIFNNWLKDIDNSNFKFKELDLLVKRFEVTKKYIMIMI